MTTSTERRLEQRGRAYALMVLATLLILLAACSRSKQEGLRVIHIATAGTMHEGQLTVTSQSARVAEEGFLARELEKRGMRLEWHYVPGNLGGPGYTEALANETVEFASYADLPALIGKAGGAPSRLIVPYGGGGNSYLVVGKDSTARSIVDLKGKRVAFQRGRPAELPFTKLIRAHQLKIEDFRVYNLASEAGQAALIAGRVDAYFGGMDAHMLEEKGVGRIIWSTKEPAGGTSIARSRVDLYARADFARDEPEITQLVATAYVRAAYWQAEEENQSAVYRVLSRPGTPERVHRKDQEGETISWRDRWSPLYDEFLYDHFRAAAAVMLERKLIQKSVDIDEFLEPRFARQALRDLQIEGFWSPRPPSGDGGVSVARAPMEARGASEPAAGK